MAATSAPAEEEYEGQTFGLESDLYSLALLSFTDLPEKAHGGYYKLPGGKMVEKIWAMAIVVVVTTAQLLMSYTIALHVRNDLVDAKTRPLQTAYEMFVGNNWTIPMGIAEAICGSWEDIETHNGVAAGPLSTIKMPDGVTYSGGVNYPLFYNLKQPTRTWDYGRLGAERSILDDVMYVIAEGVSLNPFTPSGYSVMFVITTSMFFFSVLFEFRKIGQFFMMLMDLPHEKPKEYSEEKVELTWLPLEARVAGLFAISCRLITTIVVSFLGVVFLTYTTVKIDLILNGLAIMFVVELDNAIFAATVPYKKQQMVEDLEPVVYSRAHPTGLTAKMEVFLPIVFFPATLLVALGCREYQVRTFTNVFNMAAPICMFAGPTPGGYDNFDKLVGPVTGFCDSLLGVSCAGLVVPSSAAKTHGFCVITDQTPATYPTTQVYVDDAFPGRYNADGTMKSWVDWGTVNTWPWSTDEMSLYKKGHWMNGPFQNLMRRNCVQMYRKVPPADLMADPATELMTDGAPFMCDHNEIVEAVFGPVRQDILTKAKHPESGIDTLKAIGKVRPLTDPQVVRAVDRCNSNNVRQFSEERFHAAHAAAPAAAPAASPAASPAADAYAFINHGPHDSSKLRGGKHGVSGLFPDKHPWA
jgi:hypothetical protein